ncbi:S-layer homology domain-containing protein [Paenibacillus thermotolerans]|uniref:S-layer homology domain-containing protein n=1 Tax=Paenibacillus thermotolerans TaxID=3027807 RepID=UPI002368AE11|nr:MULTISPECIES: S-layer homology domain-containing protein [unclassified Paenibacillus]
MKTFVRLACVVSLLTCLYGAPAQAQSNPVNAMWVWDFYTSMSTDAQRQELIDFSLKNNIGLLFVGTRNTLKDRPDDYAELIREAHKHRIKVFALAGNASWALQDNHSYALDQLNQVLDFNEDLSSETSDGFDGLQYDIEPYTLPDFKDNAGSIGMQMLRLLEAAANKIPADVRESFELNAAVPFWYTSGQKPLTIEYKKQRKPLSHHILDLVDSVSIMAYRDNAAGQIKLSAADVDYASTAGKKAYIGVETMPANGNSIPETITYNNKKINYLTEQMEAIRRHYSNHPGFAGVALHTYDSFKAMLQNLDNQFNVLKAAGIFNGYADGSARYGRNATRAEIAAVAARIGGYSDNNLVTPNTAHFKDVPPDAWHYGWVETAYSLGVMNGKGGGQFIPNANITVEETLIVMAKMIGLSEADGTDVQGASVWARGWVKAMVDAKLVDRRDDYKNEITREDLINIVYNTFLSYIKKEKV